MKVRSGLMLLMFSFALLSSMDAIAKISIYNDTGKKIINVGLQCSKEGGTYKGLPDDKGVEDKSQSTPVESPCASGYLIIITEDKILHRSNSPMLFKGVYSIGNDLHIRDSLNTLNIPLVAATKVD